MGDPIHKGKAAIQTTWWPLPNRSQIGSLSIAFLSGVICGFIACFWLLLQQDAQGESTATNGVTGTSDSIFDLWPASFTSYPFSDRPWRSPGNTRRSPAKCGSITSVETIQALRCTIWRVLHTSTQRCGTTVANLASWPCDWRYLRVFFSGL